MEVSFYLTIEPIVVVVVVVVVSTRTQLQALLPARIALSLYLSPAFSRRLVDPIARGVASVFRKGKN